LIYRIEAARRVADDIGGVALAADVSNVRTEVEAAFEQAIPVISGRATRGRLMRRDRYGVTHPAARRLADDRDLRSHDPAST
jgi:hypothetical protein